MIADALREARRPVSAYELIDTLREEAVLAPQTVYRALGRLIAGGQAHRLESLNAFVACRHERHETGTAIFAICDTCGSVSEFSCEEAVAALGARARNQRFDVTGMTLELRGRCSACTASAG
ncbi:MAG: Fur family transcriptional regulator [Hyphomicrobiaceae bacterium]